jgi:hypothetical protein
MLNRTVLFPLFLTLLAACGPKIKSQARVELDPLPADYEVKVFADELPRCAYEEVGIIGSRDLDATLDRARKMGADGVIGTVLAEAGRTPDDAGICGTPNCVQYNTVAIRFTDPTCTD